jgi:hypothetical protein
MIIHKAECRANVAEICRKGREKVPEQTRKPCACDGRNAYFLCKFAAISRSNIGEAKKRIFGMACASMANCDMPIPEDPFRYEKNRSGY